MKNMKYLKDLLHYLHVLHGEYISPRIFAIIFCTFPIYAFAYSVIYLTKLTG